MFEIPECDDPPKLVDPKMEVILTKPMLSRYMTLVREKYMKYKAPKLNFTDRRKPKTV